MLLCICSVLDHRGGQKCGKNKKVLASSVICYSADTAALNLFVLYIKEVKKLTVMSFVSVLQ